MAGIGKTNFVLKNFQHESSTSQFDHHAWVSLGPKYQTHEILIDILVKIYPGIDRLKIKGDEKLTRKLCEHLSGKRCLIVFDDLYSKEPLKHLKNIFLDIKAIAFVTSRLVKVARFGQDDKYLEMTLLDKEQSWCLLHQKVFGGGACDLELEKAGRMIAEKCDGVPLLILKVADQLLKAEVSLEYWNDVASGKQKSVFIDAHHQISKALLPSYWSLPQHLKACFLYIGTFREIYEILESNLSNLLIAEGFLELDSSQEVEDYVTKCLSELVDRSLVMVQLKISNLKIKTCRHHSIFWHLSNYETVKSKFFHAINSYDDCSIESIKSQHRLCIRYNILMGMKIVQNSMASNTSAHSLLCVSSLHQYQVPLDFDMLLLRVMDALTIRLYEFPVQVVRLLHLRYLALTCNGELPSSISSLWKLQYLIVKRYKDVKSSKNSSLLPLEIWGMKELKHLQVMGGCLPNNKGGTGLLKLTNLLDVSARSCRKKVLKWIPNQKRLGIRIELAPDDNGNCFRYLNRISRLRRLESLKCVVVNPIIRSEVFPLPPSSMFPSGLKKLSLSGWLRYPWEYMCILGQLKSLQVLKLKHYAFQGPTWEMDYVDQFDELNFLLLEDTNLMYWKAMSPELMKVERLCIKHCYMLQELPTFLPSQLSTKIEIVDCNPLVVACMQQMEQIITDQAKVHLS